MASRTEPSSEAHFAVRTLLQDRLTADLVVALEAAGVPTVVLKGPAIATWLYRTGEVRTYGDSDLLVAPDDWDRAMATLHELGYEDDLGSLEHPRMESFTSHPLKRPGSHVDLHCTLWGIGATPDKAWRTLSAQLTPLKIGGREANVLAPAARAMHVALHAAQHGYDEGKPICDLELATELLPDELWVEAADLARELDALPGFATGLRLVPRGRELAERLGVDAEASVDALLRVAHVPLAHGFEELATTRGARAKLSVLRKEIVPSAEFMRWWSPLARRGAVGLAASYLWRPLYLALKAGPGLLAWRRARRLAQ